MNVVEMGVRRPQVRLEKEGTSLPTDTRTVAVHPPRKPDRSGRGIPRAHLSQWFSRMQESIAPLGSPNLSSARTESSPNPTDSNMLLSSASSAAPWGRASTSSLRLSYSSNLLRSKYVFDHRSSISKRIKQFCQPHK